MTERERELTKFLQTQDPMLFAEIDGHGVFHVFRKSKRVEHFDFEGTHLSYVRDDKSYILSLTDNWTMRGMPVSYGKEAIKHRLDSIDSTRRDVVEEMFKHNERIEESNKRDLKNNVESFLLDFRKQFSKAFDGVNTGTLEKIDRRRVKGI